MTDKPYKHSNQIVYKFREFISSDKRFFRYTVMSDGWSVSHNPSFQECLIEDEDDDDLIKLIIPNCTSLFYAEVLHLPIYVVQIYSVDSTHCLQCICPHEMARYHVMLLLHS